MIQQQPDQSGLLDRYLEEAVDWSGAVLLHQLRQLELDDRTLVIFTSDNGGRAREGGSNAPLRGGKFTTWGGRLRVPCIMRWPGQLPAGQVCRQLSAALDLLPTAEYDLSERG